MFWKSSRLRAAEKEIETLRERLVARMEENFDLRTERDTLFDNGQLLAKSLAPLVKPGSRTRAEREAGIAALEAWVV